MKFTHAKIIESCIQALPTSDMDETMLISLEAMDDDLHDAQAMVLPLQSRIAELEAEVTRLKQSLFDQESAYAEPRSQNPVAPVQTPPPPLILSRRSPMPRKPMNEAKRIVWLDGEPPFKPGDPRPEGYVAFFEWADIQKAAGIEQKFCPRCRLWLFPQEPHPHH